VPIDSADIELGAVAGPVRSFVDPDEVVAFALAINDDNPRYLDGTAVPPTYAVAPALPVVLNGLPAYPPAVLAVTPVIVHAEHDVVLHRPVTPGTWLHITAERVGVLPTRAGMIIEQIVRAFDDGGGLLVEQHWVTMLTGDASGSPRGALPPDHAFPEEARARPVGRVTLGTTRDQTFRYAGASGDRSPMHVNDEIARAQGFPRKFNQGLATLGIVTRGLIELAAGGDPALVARLAVRFSAPAFPGDDIELAVYEIAGIADRGTAFAFEAHSGGATVLRHGRLETRRPAIGERYD
jgi:acyl dehydratase